ncbi:hemicentin-1-like [Ctenocephalides felis]|uniref:hemicentin-1-like n=1 Tax=Ctenocephalides felis TaxID=7515 RepID=UPI000E6E2DF0|nr:hemicentin-1-like [Ctenocephalides felis]
MKEIKPGNESQSVLRFLPTEQDHDALLICKAENPSMQQSLLEDNWQLDILYAPVVDLKMGAGLDPNDIKEGDDVYFECEVRANPPVYRLAWYHDGTELRHDSGARVIISANSLALQKVTRYWTGDITCLAANTQGRTSSAQLSLRVRFAPLCRASVGGLIGASRHEAIALTCEVESDPAPRSFRWTFNNSGEQRPLITPAQQNEHGPVSVLRYTPESDLDYGAVNCWAENAVGRQRTPCVFHLVPAGPPLPPSNCTMSNRSADLVLIECAEGFNGGLSQKFVLEAFPVVGLSRGLSHPRDTNNRQSSVSATPVFVVNLTPGGPPVRLRLYAVNTLGRSDSVDVGVFEPRHASSADEQGHSSESESAMAGPLLAGLVLAASGVLAALCVVAGALHGKRRTREQAKHTRIPQNEQYRIPFQAIVASSSSASKDVSRNALDDFEEPDIISRTQRSGGANTTATVLNLTKPPAESEWTVHNSAVQITGIS